MATGPNFAPPLPLMQPPACRLLDPPNSPPIDPFLADRLRNHRHLAIAPRVSPRRSSRTGRGRPRPRVLSVARRFTGTSRPRQPSPPLPAHFLERTLRSGRGPAQPPSARGRIAPTRVPAPGRGPTLSEPPRIPPRSAMFLSPTQRVVASRH